MKRLIALAAVVLAITCLSGTASAKHGWGTGGDSSFAATTLYDLNHYGTTTGNSALTGHPVNGDTVVFANKIVTAIDQKPSTYGFWMEEPGAGPYSGVLVYTGADNPTSLGMTVGDIVTVKGVLLAYTTNSDYVWEVNSGAAQAGFPYATSVVKTGHTTPPSPQRLVTGGIRWNTGDTCARPWFGVLCVLDSVNVYSQWPFGHVLLQQIQANTPPACMGAGIDTCHMSNKMLATTPTWPTNQQYATVQGIVHYEFETYLAPRNLTDFVPLGTAPAPNLVRAFALDATHVYAQFDAKLDGPTGSDYTNYDMINYHPTAASISADSFNVTLTVPTMTAAQAETLYVAGVKNSTGNPMVGTQKYGFRSGITPISLVQTPGTHADSSQFVNEMVTVRGVVTAGSSDFGGGAVFIQDPAGGHYSGLETYGPPITVNRGDNVTMAGPVSEFYNKTEQTVLYAVVNSSGNPVPTPIALTIGDIKNGAANAEWYEDCLVQVSGKVASDTVVSSIASWFLNNGADTTRVGRNATYSYIPVPGVSVNVIGILDYSTYGFGMQPRMTSDLYGGSSGVGNNGSAFTLKQSFPNPFNTRTTVAYSIAKAGNASLKIYNVAGQVVRTLVDGNVSAGNYTASWDGKAQDGRTASSGIYYARLVSGSQSQSRKLVLSR